MRGGRIPMLAISFTLFSSLTMAQVSTLSLVSSDEFIEPDELNNVIDVEVFIDQAAELVGWQVRLEVTGGDAGSLDLVNLFIDEANPDYVFGGAGFSSISMVFLPLAEMGAVLISPVWVEVTAPAYLGTFQLQPSADALGVFNIRLVADTNVTFLILGEAVHVFPNLDNDTVIEVVECIIDADCDDQNVCTDDTCDNGTCVLTNDDTNTCTDGNDCTDDACTSGTCVSTNDDTNTCTDGNDCTDDSCSSGACVSTNDDTNTCTDGNDCTSDTCVSGVCTSSNEPINTPCDDGLFCTATDECDGSGTCVGSGSPCGARRPYCCEFLSICGMFPCI